MTLSLEQAVRFGPYRTYPGQRLILEADRPLRLGRRAMDILLILLEHAGQLVSKQELIARVWPDSVVEDINLRVHMAALRKALGDGQAGQRYIVTVAQRGYSFVAPCQWDLIEPQPPEGSLTDSHNLPLRRTRTRMIGRQALLASMVQHFAHQRFITLVGPGGIGKTTVALSVAEQLIGHYRDGIRLLDLAPLDNPTMVADGRQPAGDSARGLRSRSRTHQQPRRLPARAADAAGDRQLRTSARRRRAAVRKTPARSTSGAYPDHQPRKPAGRR